MTGHIEMMDWADRVALGSKCTERQVGAVVLFSDGKRAAVANDCKHDSTNRHHAEARLILKTFGLDGDRGQFKGATLYVTCRPCARCTAMLLPLGLKAIYYRDAQPEMGHLSDLVSAGVLVDGGWIKARQPIPLEAVQQSWAERWPRKLDQSVFKGLPPEYQWAAVESDGRAYAHVRNPKDARTGVWRRYRNYAVFLVGSGYDTSDWQNSLIAKAEVTE